MQVRRTILIAVAGAVLVTGCGGGSKGKTSGTATQLVAAGLVASQQGDNKAAESAFRAAVNRDPKNQFAHYNLGYLAQLRGDSTGALKEYDLAIAVDPKMEPALYNSGTIYGATEPTKAIDLYRRVLAVNPKNGAAAFNLGLLEAQAGDKVQGLKDVRRGIAVNPDLANRVPNGLFPAGALTGAATAPSPSSSRSASPSSASPSPSATP